MRQGLIDLLCCPACGSKLQIIEPSDAAGEIWEGTLRCIMHSHVFPIVRGIPHLYVDDDAWQPKKREAEGWVKLAKQQGIYEQGEKPIDLRIPYVDDPIWSPVAEVFDVALETLQLTGSERILDLGAGRGWAAKQFALLGHEVVAVDIVPDEYIGLGRAHALMTDADVTFDLVIGDGEKLPLQEGVFDIVFCCGVLHHALDLRSLLDNIAHVLASGGILCAIYEPCLSVWQSEDRTLNHAAEEELSVGINESIPTFADYLTASDASHLHLVEAYPSNVYDRERTDWTRSAQEVGAMWWGLHLSSPFASLRGTAYYVARRFFALLRGARPHLAEMQEASADKKAQASILTWCGGHLFLLAQKGANSGLANTGPIRGPNP